MVAGGSIPRPKHDLVRPKLDTNRIGHEKARRPVSLEPDNPGHGGPDNPVDRIFRFNVEPDIPTESSTSAQHISLEPDNPVQ